MSKGVQAAVQAVLLLVIIGLSYFLYLSVTEPYAKQQAQEAIRNSVRARMDQVRQGLIRFQNQRGRFPSSLDSLVIFVREDSLLNSPNSPLGQSFVADSLPFSPRTGNRFLYATSPDTMQTQTYLLTDPDNPEDYIGTDQGDAANLNRASWE